MQFIFVGFASSEWERRPDRGREDREGMDRVDALLRDVDRIPVEFYAASGMVRVGPERRVAGRAFVPVGRGHAPATAFPRGGVMVLGQDFGNEGNLDEVFAAGEETDAVPTWRAIGRILPDEGIPMDACWFTNYVMGVRPGRGSNCKGRSPGLRPGALRRACADLFVRQLRAQEPCALLVLGTYVPPALAADFPQAFQSWTARSFARRDDEDRAAIRDVRIADITVPLVVSVLHPSLRDANLARRRFDGRCGAEAESGLFRLVHAAVRERPVGHAPVTA